jgi:hypothetical protein
MREIKKIQVYKDGELLKEGIDFNLRGDSIYFIQKPRKKQNIIVEYYRSLIDNKIEDRIRRIWEKAGDWKFNHK